MTQFIHLLIGVRQTYKACKNRHQKRPWPESIKGITGWEHRPVSLVLINFTRANGIQNSYW